MTPTVMIETHDRQAARLPPNAGLHTDAGLDPLAWPLAVVVAPVEVDAAAGARLLRWCEAWLHRLDVGEAHLAHLLVNMRHTRRATPPGLAVLEQARTEARRRGVGIHLVGVGALLVASSLEVRASLGRWSSFPDLDAACAALVPAPRKAEPVDPDAIVLVTPAPQRCG